MGDDRDRQEILDCAHPDELFGEAATDPRALRKAYATLAKRWKHDPQVSAHVRELFDTAREGPSPPTASDAGQPAAQTPSAELAAAREAGSAQGVFDALVHHRNVLKQTAPDAMASALDELLIYAGPTLSLAALDALEVLVADPSWEVEPHTVDRWQVQLAHLRSLQRASASGELPDALLDGIRDLWAEPGHRAAEVWLRTARALDGTDLDALLAQVEADWPGLMSQIGVAEARMAELAATAPLELPDALREELQLTYPASSNSTGTHMKRTLRYWGSMKIRVPMTLAVYLALIPILGFYLGIVASYVVRVLLTYVIALTLGAVQSRAQYAQLHEMPVEPLLQIARAHALLPGELAAAVNPAEEMTNRHAYAPGHPLLELERLDSGVLRTLTPALVDRLTEAARQARP